MHEVDTEYTQQLRNCHNDYQLAPNISCKRSGCQTETPEKTAWSK